MSPCLVNSTPAGTFIRLSQSNLVQTDNLYACIIGVRHDQTNLCPLDQVDLGPDDTPFTLAAMVFLLRWLRSFDEADLSQNRLPR